MLHCIVYSASQSSKIEVVINYKGLFHFYVALERLISVVPVNEPVDSKMIQRFSCWTQVLVLRLNAAVPSVFSDIHFSLCSNLLFLNTK